MRKRSIITCVVVAVLLLPALGFARDIPLFVSGDWLTQNLTNPKVKVVDIRKVEEYKEGHIPGSFNAFFGSWVIKKGDLRNELPNAEDLADVIGGLGISSASWVIIAGKAGNIAEITDATRVVWTLKYAGIENVALLDGGYDGWIKDKRTMAPAVTKPASSGYKPQWNKAMAVDKGYVQKAQKKTAIIDARLPDFFFGVAKLDFVDKAGHIPGAASLPSAWMFTKEGMIKGKGDLEGMAQGVIGQDKAREVIIYCDTGKVCTAWFLVLHDILGYKNVKNYEGSMEEWSKDPNAPVVKYRWN